MIQFTKLQKKEIQKIGDVYNLDFIILHGSQATGSSISPEPDIDIAVYRKGGISFSELVNLSTDFINILGYNVDVKSLNKVDSLFRFEVLSKGILIYGDKVAFNEFFVYAYKDYHESKPLFKTLAVVQKKRQELLNEQYVN